MCPDLAIPALTAAVLRSHQCHRGAPEVRRCLTRRVARSLCATTEAAMGSARPERRLRLWERLRLQERVQRRRLELQLHLLRAVRRDRQEASRPFGQGGPASPEPAAVHERIMPARARGRFAARHSEALLQGSGAGARSTPRPLAAAACRGENSSTREPATLEKYVHPQLTRKVSEGLLRFHPGGVHARSTKGAPA